MWCEPNKSLANACLESGEMYQKEVVLFSTIETQKAQALKLGLPVLVRDDGAMSKDAKKWIGGKDGSRDKNIKGHAESTRADDNDSDDKSL